MHHRRRNLRPSRNKSFRLARAYGAQQVHRRAGRYFGARVVLVVPAALGVHDEVIATAEALAIAGEANDVHLGIQVGLLHAGGQISARGHNSGAPFSPTVSVS